MLSSVRADGPDLSARQMTIFLQVYLAAPPHTVRGLAETLRIAKPAVVRALDTLGQLDFTRRKRDETDKRNVLIQRTVKGSVFLSDFADQVVAAVEAV
ncbi:MAG: winged helix-turn-helix transcriptional regulator [Alphaproteobacteria bacterium]|nr:winged helix-turn-helix transcriptional regulator [Alphaproteobacteria bacterium]